MTLPALLLANTKFHDVTFVVGSQQAVVTANRAVLACNSSMFEKLLYGEMIESRKDSRVIVTDIDEVAFRTVLSFCYLNKAELNPENVMHTLYAAKKYLLDTLRQECVAWIDAHLNIDTGCLLLAQALELNEEELAQRCEKVVFKCGAKILESDTFADLSPQLLLRLVSNAEFVAPEVDIFRACMQWAAVQLDRSGTKQSVDSMRVVLSDVLSHIRFGEMKSVDIAGDVRKSGVLPGDDVLALLARATLREHKVAADQLPELPACYQLAARKPGDQLVAPAVTAVELIWDASTVNPGLVVEDNGKTVRHSSAGHANAISTQSFGSGKVTVQAQIVMNGGAWVSLGVVNGTGPLPQRNEYQLDGRIVAVTSAAHPFGNVVSGTACKWATGDIIGIALDFNTRQIGYTRNGATAPFLVLKMPDGNLRIFANLYTNNIRVTFVSCQCE
eukprot:TRINITY_DN3386_c0_g2_i1.p1 TRINITY_DN3386_c0_g2~~TRINITY_DN3386_c0_g2_i1.p1  ORF type:complete len:445 (-),score=83.35 TRINITY_DN3386_c0_g2_i1:340-1674(-)